MQHRMYCILRSADANRCNARTVYFAFAFAFLSCSCAPFFNQIAIIVCQYISFDCRNFTSAIRQTRLPNEIRPLCGFFLLFSNTFCCGDRRIGFISTFIIFFSSNGKNERKINRSNLKPIFQL